MMFSTIMDDAIYLLNSLLLGEDPTVEDFILLVGTCVAFIAFILWCCFPVTPKDTSVPSHYGYRRADAQMLSPEFKVRNFSGQKDVKSVLKCIGQQCAIFILYILPPNLTSFYYWAI